MAKPSKQQAYFGEPWQIEQGNKCGCRGTDDYCSCQNIRPWPPLPKARGDDAADVLRDILTLRAQEFGGVVMPTESEWRAVWTRAYAFWSKS